MNFLICVIAHNRLDYTKDCLRALDENTSHQRDWSVVVVDNASTDGTQEWLKSADAISLIDEVVLNPNNRYPGAACNQGWNKGLRLFDQNFTHLLRLDNDCKVQPGWYEDVEQAFESFPDLGQFGLIEMSGAKEFQYVVQTNDETGFSVNTGPTNIGGPNVITRQLWDEGLRYSESPWQHHGGPTPQEDVFLSLDIKKMGKFFGNTVKEICIEQSFGNTDLYFDYYQRTFSQRGYGPPARTLHGSVLEPGGLGNIDHI